MRAIVVRELGPPEVLKMEQWPDASPGPEQVQVAVSYAGVNFTDTEHRRGVYPTLDLPWIPGIEASGTVTAVGPGVPAELHGTRVALAAPRAELTGTYATAVTVSLSRIFPVPEELALETAAALLVQGLTAFQLVNTMGRVRGGQTVLVHAAAGGVGHLAVQLARLAGARVLGTTSRAVKAPVIAAAGAEPFVLDPSARWVEDVRAATGGRGVDVVLDSVGARTQPAGLSLLAPQGHLVHFGHASGPVPPIDPDVLYSRSLSVSAYWLWAPHEAGELTRAAEAVFALAVSGKLQVHVDDMLPLAEAAEAHRRLEAGATRGKLLLIAP